MGKIIENYALQEIVGEGMYGKVYKAVHVKTNQEFAVKVIPALKFRENPKLQQCTVNQINILSTIESSPYIIKYVEMLKTPNNFYFIYQYCNGKTLESLLKQENKLPETRALKIFRQLLQAFKVLNKYNIMHRDLKPDNIFFHNGNLKLGDFGFCRTLAKGSDMASTMLGSPIYMAPQVLKGEIYTSKADIWSLGVVLFEMLYGYCPFESNSIAKLISVLADNDLKLPEGIIVSANTQQLLKKLLTKDQFKRIDWFQLLQYNITEDGIIADMRAPEHKFEELRQVFSQKDISESKYVKSDSNNTTSATINNTTNPNELVFKKKTQTITKTPNFVPTTFNKAKTTPSTPNSPPVVDQTKKFDYNKYNFLSPTTPKKSNFNDEVNRTENISNFTSPPIMKKVTLDNNIKTKRKQLLQQHLICLNGVKTAISFVKAEDSNALIYSYLLFQKVNERLKKICENISITDLELQDVVYAINHELKQIQRQIAQIRQELNKSEFLQLSEFKSLLKPKFKHTDPHLKLWFDMLHFLNDQKPLQKEPSSYEMTLLIHGMLS